MNDLGFMSTTSDKKSRAGRQGAASPLVQVIPTRGRLRIDKPRRTAFPSAFLVFLRSSTKLMVLKAGH